MHEGQRPTLGVVLQELTILFFETESPVGIWCLSIRLSYLASKPQGSACLCLLSVGITSTCNHARLFTQVLENKIMSSCLHCKYFTEFFYFLNFFRFVLYVCVFHLHIYTCIPYECLVPTEIRGGL